MTWNHGIDAALGIQVIESPFVSDYRIEPRTWKERLWSLPWRPWQSTKRIHDPKYFSIKPGQIICSPASAARLRREMKL